MSQPQTNNKGRKRKKRKSIFSKSVGALILNRERKVLLVFQAQNQYWEFPKGKVETGEKELQTLRREIDEETGIRRLKIIKPFRHSVHYTFRFEGSTVRRKVVYYLVRSDDAVRISDEHSDFQWVSLGEAKKILRHDNQKKLIRKVERLIEKHDKRNGKPNRPPVENSGHRSGGRPQ